MYAVVLGRQLPVCCLDVAVITVSSLVCLTSIAVVACLRERSRYSLPDVVSGLAVLSLPTE